MKLGVIFSPRSGYARRKPETANRLRSLLGRPEAFFPCASVAALDTALAALRGVSTIAVCGGDGTNHLVLTRAAEIYGASALPTFAFLRGGTMNTVANGIGVARGTPVSLLKAVLREQPLRFAARSTLRINGELGFLFGTGVVHGFLAEYYRNGTPSPKQAAQILVHGALSAVVSGATVKRMARPFRGHVEFDDGTAWPERDYLALAAGTIDQIGLGFKPFYRCLEHPDHFHLLGIHTSPFGLVRALPKVYRGRPMGARKAYELTATGATIFSVDGEVCYMVDGDLRTTDGPLRIELGPRIQIILGAT